LIKAVAEQRGLNQKQIRLINPRKHHWKPSEDWEGFHPQNAISLYMVNLPGTVDFRKAMLVLMINVFSAPFV
jgi:hypothetical protein